tara:strand:- start:8350 stop:8580 length:231 start_codon:yes stop_codon:yes gene_type:complete
MKKNEIKLTPKKLKFIETYGVLGDSEILKELLFANQIQIEKLEKIRGNTSMLVWWLVAIPILSFILFLLLGGSMML